jgi:putative transposase
MPRVRRTHLDAPFFHVLNRSVRHMPIFTRPPDYRAFLSVLQEGLDRFPVRLVAFCLLSNQWRLVLEPAGTDGMIRFMHWVTTTHAVRWNCRRDSQGAGPVYQGRYLSVPIEGMGDLMRVCRDVERNALKDGLVRRAQDWPWCSLAERLRPSPEVSLKPARFLTSQTWINHVNEEESDPTPPARAPRRPDPAGTARRGRTPARTPAPDLRPC